LALVWGLTRAEEAGWDAGPTIAMFIASAALLVAFVFVESRTEAPLLPLRIVTDRNRAGVYLGIGLAMIGNFAQFLFLAYYLQQVKGYTPLVSGLAFMPMTICLTIGSTQIGARLMTRFPARRLMVPGFLATALAMVVLAQLTPDSSYWAIVLPAQILLGLGMGTAFTPGMNLATYGVQPHDAGAASAMLNTSQQVGGSVGTALLNTIAASATAGWLASHSGTGSVGGSGDLASAAATHGFTTAFWWAAGILALAAVIVAVCVRAGEDSDSAAPISGVAPADAAVPAVAH
jgi:predicted MFS family arabinose efflux permease